MDLSALFFHLDLSSPSLEGEPNPPITEVLLRLQERLTAAASTSSHPEAAAAVGLTEQLLKTAPPHWLFSPPSTGWGDAGLNQSHLRSELQGPYAGLVQCVIGAAALPLCDEDCSSLPVSSYQGVPERALLVCSALTALLRGLGAWERQRGAGGEVGRDSLVPSVVPLCCVFAVTHFQEQAWTTFASRQAAGRLLQEVLNVGEWRDPMHLLVGDRKEEEMENEEAEEAEEDVSRGEKGKGMLGGLLDVLQPELTKDKWQRCEAVKLVFSWALLQVPRPHLSPHLPRLLPPSLLLSDHHVLENSILGVRCLHHIVVNTPAAELRRYNRAEVLYQAVFKHMYSNEAALIQVVLPCLLDLLAVLEKPPRLACTSGPRKPGRHDDVLRLFLTHMEMEHKVALRRAYAAHLCPYIDRAGLAVCRHLRRVERVAVSYLEVADPPEERSRLGILEALEETLRVAWPRMESRVNVLLPSLLRLLVDVSSDPLLCAPVKEQLTSRATRCLTLLDHCTRGKLQPLLQQVDSTCASPPVLRCLAAVSITTPR